MCVWDDDEGLNEAAFEEGAAVDGAAAFGSLAVDNDVLEAAGFEAGDHDGGVGDWGTGVNVAKPGVGVAAEPVTIGLAGGVGADVVAEPGVDHVVFLYDAGGGLCGAVVGEDSVEDELSGRPGDGRGDAVADDVAGEEGGGEQ